jgi:hypothetical protein
LIEGAEEVSINSIFSTSTASSSLLDSSFFASELTFLDGSISFFFLASSLFFLNSFSASF